MTRSPAQRLQDLAAKSWATPSQTTPLPQAAVDERAILKIKSLARTVLTTNKMNWDGARDAFYAAVKDDAPLLWELFRHQRADVVNAVLTSVAGDIRDDHRRAQAAALVPDTLRLQAPAVKPRATAAAGIQARVEVTARSLLDTFVINRKPIGDMTPTQARAWAGARERDARFVRILTANLPPSEPIRKYRTADDAAHAYDQAETADLDA